MDVKSARVERGEQTRRTLLSYARHLFAREGYAEASTREIVYAAGLTKGALYHHFKDKLDLYRAVVEEMAQELVEGTEAAATDCADPWERLQTMCRAYLDASLDSELTRILVLDAPAVLGWKAWCEIGERHEIRAFAACLRAAAAAGQVLPHSEEGTAQVLLGALNTAARLIATAPDPAAAHVQAERTIGRLLAGLHA
jgi:AcrR family transcriptional regulator